MFFLPPKKGKMNKDEPRLEILRFAEQIERRREPSVRSNLPSDALTNDVRVEVMLGREVEIEITYDRPTTAERKAVEDFFDWLLAEALRFAGEVDEAA